MKGTKMNRTLVLICFMGLAGWLAFLGSQPQSALTAANILTILTATGAPVGIYIGVKGKGSADPAIQDPLPGPELRGPGE